MKMYCDAKGFTMIDGTEFSASTILYKATTSTQMSLLPLWVSVSAQTTLH